MDNDNYKNIKRYLEDSYKYIKIPEEAYQHNFGYIEGFNDAKGLSKDEYRGYGMVVSDFLSYRCIGR